MMTIAYIVTAQTHEGPLNVVKALIREMTKRGNVCTLLYLEDREEIDFGCEKKRIGYWDDIDLAAFDVVHTHGIKPMWFVYLYLLRHRLHDRPEQLELVATGLAEPLPQRSSLRLLLSFAFHVMPYAVACRIASLPATSFAALNIPSAAA